MAMLFGRFSLGLDFLFHLGLGFFFHLGLRLLRHWLFLDQLGLDLGRGGFRLRRGGLPAAEFVEWQDVEVAGHQRHVVL